MTNTIKRLILRGSQEREINEAALREGMTSLKENGLRLVFNGITTLEEVYRVTVGVQEAQEL